MKRPDLVDDFMQHGSNITMTRPAARKYITQLEADVERLREALARIRDEPGPDRDDSLTFEYFARNVAKRALEVGE